MAAHARELKIWQEAVSLGGEVIRAARRATRRETKAFTDALMLTASDAASAISEAHAHSSSAGERDCYARAKRALITLETQLAIARNGGVITPADHAQLAGRVAALSQRVSNYLSYAERQTVTASEPVGRSSSPLPETVVLLE
jgi:four helix bundle protein